MLTHLREWYAVALQRTPPWAHPVVHGAALNLVASTPGAVLASLMDPEIPFYFVPPFLVLMAGCGGSAGLAYSLVGRRLQRVARVGTYLAGVVVTAALCLPFFGLILIFGEPTAGGVPVPASVLWFSLIATALALGFVMGRFLRDL